MSTARVKATAQFTLLFLFLLVGCIASAASSNPPENRGVTRVACVGDSITFGYSIPNREMNTYPVQLGRMLGAQWEVRNFGVSGATMMNAGNKPYVKQPQYQQALDYKPDVLIIALGTNDSKPANIDAHPEDFTPSYEKMIAEFRKANPRVRVFVCLPPPAFSEAYKIRDTAIAGTIIPQIRAIAAKHHATLIDLHTALANSKAGFPDGIHPNAAGAAEMANAILHALVSPAAEELSNKRVLWLGDSITNRGDYVTFVSYFLNKQYPQSNFDIVSIGLSSETACGLSEKTHPFPRPNVQERLDRALKTVKPKIVFASYGMNDGIYHPLSPERMQAFQTGIQTLITKVKAAGAQLVLLTPTPFDARPLKNTLPASAADFGFRAPFEGYDSVLAAYAKWELSLPASDVRVIDLHTPMAEYIQQQRQSNPEFTFTRDGIHPNQAGHLLMAETILKALGVPVANEGELNARMSSILAEPLFPLVRKARETRSEGWLPYVGYVREKKMKTDSIDATEKSVSDLQKQIDTIRRSSGKLPQAAGF